MEFESGSDEEERERERERKRERNTVQQRTKRKKKKLRKSLADNLLLDVPDFEDVEAPWSGDVGRSRAGEEAPTPPTKKQKKKKKKKRGKKKGGSEVDAKATSDDVTDRQAAAEAAAPKPKSKLLDKMRNRLQGSQFRWLNEKLYTCSGTEAFEMMQKDERMFENYHAGFQTQTEHWPVKPVDVAIAFVEKKAANRPHGGLCVADFGCGDADIAKHFSGQGEGARGEGSTNGGAGVQCHSFDLVSKSPLVVACNMASVPMASSTCDVAIFCLALMGTDYPLFLREAARVMKARACLWIAEVRSRFSGVKGGDGSKSAFLRKVCDDLDLRLVRHDNSNKMFVTFVFEKRKTNANAGSGNDKRRTDVAAWPKLTSCVYKKR